MPDQKRVLGHAAVANELMDIAATEQAFSGTSQQVALAYAQSYTLVEYLHGLRPRGGIGAFIENLSITADLDRAMIRTYSMTRGEIEREWLQRIRSEYLNAAFPPHAELVIFAAMALLFLGVVVVQKRRRAAIRRRMMIEEEEYKLLGKQ